MSRPFSPTNTYLTSPRASFAVFTSRTVFHVFHSVGKIEG